MKKIVIATLLILFIATTSFSQVIRNAPDKGGSRLYLGVSPYLLAPGEAFFNVEGTFDYVSGLRKAGLFRVGGGIELSRLFLFDGSLTFITDESVLNSLQAGWELRPLNFLSLHLDYSLQNYSKYWVMQHNITMITEFYLEIAGVARLSAEFGHNFRFVDLDLRDNGTVYQQDWLFELSFNYRLQALFHPAKIYSLGLSIGNMNRLESFSFGYLQFEFLNSFLLPYNFEIIANVGFGYAGSFSMAGYINRVWGTIGVKYKIKVG